MIAYIADRTHIKLLRACTLRVGKKEAQMLAQFSEAGKLDMAHLVVGSVMGVGGAEKAYGYMALLDDLCARKGWIVKRRNNHGKIYLFDTDAGRFVLETSSNLNENPQSEFFVFQKDAQLYAGYSEVFDDWLSDESVPEV